MTTEEQLKIYAAYLPHNATAETVLGTKFTMKGISYRGLLQDEKGFDMGAMGTTKLHLWDLSYLTEEIEHEGRVFIPIVELAKEFHITSEKAVIKYDDILDHYEFGIQVSCYVDDNRYSYFSISGGDLILHNDYRIIQKLLSWHFNIFGIPAGEFIPKTLKTESNGTTT